MAEIGLVLFGTPRGFDASQCDRDTYHLLELFYGAMKRPGTEMRVFRQKNETYYVFLMNHNPGSSFVDSNVRPGAFFGMAFILKDLYVTDTDRVYKLFQTTYEKYVKGKIIDEGPSGWRKFIVSRLNVPNDELGNYVFDGFCQLMTETPELNLKGHVAQLPPIQNTNQRY